MLYQKDDFPENNEIVYCKVKKIYSNSIILDLVEYSKEGVMVVSEVAPGRIRNIRDYVNEGRYVVCKVLRVNRNKNHIDLSLRRVSVNERKNKIDYIKKEEFAEKIYNKIAEELGITTESLFKKTYKDIFKKYASVFELLEAIVNNKESIDIFKKLNDKEKEIFLKVIQHYIKPQEIIIKENIKIYSLKEIDEVKEILRKAIKDLNYENIELIYLSAGNYQLKIIHKDKKQSYRILEKFKKNLGNFLKKYDVVLNT